MTTFVADHEAGHAVVAEVLGIGVDEIGVEHLAIPGKPKVAGFVGLSWKAGETRSDAREVMYAAGWAASLLAGEHPDRAEAGAAGDLRILRDQHGVTDAGVIRQLRGDAGRILGEHRDEWDLLRRMIHASGLFTGQEARAAMGGEPIDGWIARRSVARRWRDWDLDAPPVPWWER